MSALVIDTNIALDLLVFEDPAVAALRDALHAQSLGWLATAAMREELLRVLEYPQIARRLRARDLPAQAVLDRFDQLHRPVPEAAKAPYTCRDPDDQKFIDLAVAYASPLLSKDAAVLCMAKRLSRVGVRVCRVWSPVALEMPVS
ncbi:MAG: PIN domain-containing protein [Hydrogenophaga sp.]|nr:PIN domain-containing protein [Hydrogenophaga sp.]